MGGLDFGGPAVMEPWLFRPETLRRHLSVGLPCLKSATILATFPLAGVT